MSVPESEEDHAWVTDALSADEPGPMPSYVADRVLAALGAATGSSSTLSRAEDRRSSDTRRATAPPAAVPPAAVPPAAVPPAAVPPDSWRGTTGTGDVSAPPARTRAGSSRADTAPGATGGPPAPAAHDDDVPDTAAEPRSRSGVTVLTGGRRSGRAEAESDRRHFALYRLLPVAASMVVLAAASGVVATQLRGEEDQLAASAAQEANIDLGPRPNGLVATGTSYTAAELADQAAGLLTEVAQDRSVVAAPQAAAAEGSGEAAGAAPEPARPSDGAAVSALAQDATAELSPDPLVASPLASAAAFRECARTLGAAEGVLPAAVDLAIFEGSEAAIVVLPNRAGDGYEVIVTDRFCSPDTERASETFVGG